VVPTPMRMKTVYLCRSTDVKTKLIVLPSHGLLYTVAWLTTVVRQPEEGPYDTAALRRGRTPGGRLRGAGELPRGGTQGPGGRRRARPRAGQPRTLRRLAAAHAGHRAARQRHGAEGLPRGTGSGRPVPDPPLLADRRVSAGRRGRVLPDRRPHRGHERGRRP